jgi:dethiobiotin synthetase
MKSIFITGIGTGIGKTVVSAILVEALEADYWKPVQAGFEKGTDSQWISSVLSNKKSRVFPEVYRLAMAASPHIAARMENKTISLDEILEQFRNLDRSDRPLIVEGAGGLMVPLNEKEFVIHLIKKLGAEVILVSRNYLGSINHSLLTGSECRRNNLNVTGWIFNDQYLHYEDEIVEWSGYKKLGSVPKAAKVNRIFIQQQAELLKKTLI